MSEEPITEDDWALAASDIGALFRAVKNGSRAPDLLLAIEMVVQGIAFIQGVEVEVVRMEVARGWAAPSVDLGTLQVQGTA